MLCSWGFCIADAEEEEDEEDVTVISPTSYQKKKRTHEIAFMDFPQRKIDLEENLPSWLRGDRHSPPPCPPFELVHPMDDVQIAQTVQSAAVPMSDAQNSIIFDVFNRYAYSTLQPYLL